MRAGQAIGSRLATGASSGAGLGPVQGFNEGEGRFANGAWNGAGGAGTGLAIGAVAPVAGVAIGAGVRALIDRAQPALPGIGRATTAEAVNACERAGPAMVRQRAAELGHDAMMLDLDQPFLGRAQGIAAMPGEAGERVVSGLQARNAGTNPGWRALSRAPSVPRRRPPISRRSSRRSGRRRGRSMSRRPRRPSDRHDERLVRHRKAPQQCGGPGAGRAATRSRPPHAGPSTALTHPGQPPPPLSWPRTLRCPVSGGARAARHPL